MLKALERQIASVDERIVLLAPSAYPVSDCFKNIDVDSHRYDQLMHDVQRLRGGIYLKDGAIQRQQLSLDGRHRTPEDEESWHLVMLNEERRVSGCIWYLQHKKPALEQLRVRNCPLAHCDEWGDTFRLAIESDIARAQRENIRYAEVGGWAVAPDSRGTSEGVLLALGVYSLSQIVGEALVITTATARHCSSAMLRRLGGSRWEIAGSTLPAYYDAKYKCEMELLRFDSREPNPKYAKRIGRLRDTLADALVVTRSTSTMAVNPYDVVVAGKVSAHPSVAA
jgi:hypothetical protein